MTGSEEQESDNAQKGKIIFVSSSILDMDLFRSSRFEILANLAERGYNTCLVAMRSKNICRINNSRVQIISVPLRYVPILSNVMHAIILLFLVPLYIIISDPDFVVTHPDISTIGSVPGLILGKVRRTKFILDVRSTIVEAKGVQGFLLSSLFSTSIAIAKKHFDA